MHTEINGSESASTRREYSARISAIHSFDRVPESTSMPPHARPPVSSATAIALLSILYAPRLSRSANFCAQSLVTVTEIPDCARVINRKYTEEMS